MRLAVIGTGYVGLVAGACFSDFGNEVVCVDLDADRVERLRRGEIPIVEPRLDEVVRRNLAAGRLSFTTSTAEAVPGVDVVVPAVARVEFAQGQTTRTIPLTILHDGVAEGSVPETLVLALQNPGAGWALGPVPSVTVALVKGTVQFSRVPYVVSEGSGSKTITVTRSGPTTQPVTVARNPASAPPSSCEMKFAPMRNPAKKPQMGSRMRNSLNP